MSLTWVPGTFNPYGNYATALTAADDAKSVAQGVIVSNDSPFLLFKF
jgi:hypothetical protein